MNGGEQTWASAVPLQFSFLLLPVCFAVAVLRYRLYDVELIVNRAIVLGAGHAVRRGRLHRTGGRGRSHARRAGRGFWPSIVATAVVALAFQPLRSSVVRFADRLAYGSRAAPYDALSDSAAGSVRARRRTPCSLRWPRPSVERSRRTRCG